MTLHVALRAVLLALLSRTQWSVLSASLKERQAARLRLYSVATCCATVAVCWRRDKHRGYGFVKFDESAHAAAAAEKLNGQTVGGGDKPLRVEFSTQSPKQSRASKKSASKDKENATGSAKEKKVTATNCNAQLSPQR